MNYVEGIRARSKIEGFTEKNYVEGIRSRI